MIKTLIVAMSLAALAGCERSTTPGTESNRTAPPQKITVAYTNQPQSTLVHVALAKGYFTEEGLAVQPVLRAFGKAALQTVVEHQTDFATVAETPVMFNILQGKNICVIANIEASTVNNAIVARKDAGITAPADLKGKRVAFTPGTTSDFFLDTLLTANGLTRKDIRPIELQPDEFMEAIQNKRIDAASTWNYPLTLIKHRLGDNGVLFYDREIYTETFNIAALQDFVQKNPDAVRRFLRALLKAEDFVARDPAAAQAIMSADTHIDLALIREVWNAFNYRVVLDQTLPLTLEDETRWAIRNKLTERKDMPDYPSFICSDELKALKPAAVRIGR